MLETSQVAIVLFVMGSRKEGKKKTEYENSNPKH